MRLLPCFSGHFFFAFLLLLVAFNLCCSAGRNQLEVVFAASETLHTLRRAVEKRDLKSFPVIVILQALYQLHWTVILFFFFWPSN